MRKLIIELIAAAALTAAAILALAPGARASDIVVTGAFARASATPAARTASVYLSLTNRGTVPDRLVALASAAARRAEVHETVTEDGVMKMRAAASIDLPPGSTVALAPGGRHIMLSGLASPLARGASLELTMTFETAGEVKVVVPIAGVAADRPDQAAGSSGG